MWQSTYVLWAMAVASSYNLTFLTIERYVAITMPFTYNIDTVNKRLPFVLLAAWFIGFLLPWVNLVITRVDGDQCKFQSVYNPPLLGNLIPVYFFVVDCLIPAVIMLCAYVRMGMALRKSSELSNAKPDGHNKAPAKARQAEVNIYQTCFMLMIVFVLCWLNNCIGVTLFVIGYFSHMNTSYHNISTALIVFNSCLNPYVYVVRYTEFQQQVKYILSAVRKCKINNSA